MSSDKGYYDLLSKNSNSDLSDNTSNIKTDFNLILILLKDLLIFILMLIPNLFLMIFNFIFGKREKSQKYFERVFLEPFNLIKKIIDWFFEAKITAFLIITLIITYLVQVFFLQLYLHNLMTHQLHFFEGNYYSILTSVFLHGDLIHLGSNCLSLLIFGRIVERQVGFNTIFLFLWSGIFANLVSNYISYTQEDFYYSLGASGAIAGLIMFAIMFSPFAFTTIFILPLPICIVGWALIFWDIISLSVQSNINHYAHLGGYCALLVSFFFLEIRHKKKIITGLIINAILLVVFFVLSRVIDLSFLF